MGLSRKMIKYNLCNNKNNNKKRKNNTIHLIHLYLLKYICNFINGMILSEEIFKSKIIKEK